MNITIAKQIEMAIHCLDHTSLATMTQDKNVKYQDGLSRSKVYATVREMEPILINILTNCTFVFKGNN